MAEDSRNNDQIEEVQGGFLGFFTRMSPGQLVALGIMVFAGLVLIFSVFYYASREEMVPLFTAAVDAQSHVQIRDELNTRGIDYTVSDGNKFLVPKSRAQALRTEFEAMNIAPSNNTGWDVLDQTNPLKAGESMMKLKKLQALELEIENMLEANPMVMAAKVKIRPAKDSPFADETEPAKASIMLRLKSMAKMGPNQVMAMQQLVASSIEGASPGDVTITDQHYNLLTRPQADDAELAMSSSNLELQSKYERDLENKIEALLETWLGPGKSIAKVSLNLNFDQTERLVKVYGGADAEGEPQAYAEQIKTETIRRGDNLQGATGAAPNTAQGGIPQDTANDAGTNINRQNETKQYFVNEEQIKTREAPFSIDRMTIALQLDYKETEVETRQPGFFDKLTSTTPDWIETRYEPLTQEELARVEELAKGATGFEAQRDFISIANFPFKPPISKRAQAAMDTGLLLEYLQRWTPFILRMILFAAFVFVAISLFRRFVAPILQQAQLEEPAISAALPSGPPKTVAELESELEQEIEASIPSAQLSKSEIMKKRLIEMTQTDPEAVAGLVRTWLLEEE
jgi:flagellar M-ring protein FliF